MLEVLILGSGSGGNCALISSPRTSILLDAGFSRRETLRRLDGRSLERLACIVISHEHSDHVAGLPGLSRKLEVPVYLNSRTHAALGAAGEALPRVEYFTTGQSWQVGDIEITPFTIPHDAVDPVAFTLSCGSSKVCFVTDLGYIPENVKDQLKGADCLVLESNHDLDLLKIGPYPWPVKQRVMSRVGHLSNLALAEYLTQDFDGCARHLVLAHLSQSNNLPELAQLTAEAALRQAAKSPRLTIAKQDQPLPAILLE